MTQRDNDGIDDERLTRRAQVVARALLCRSDCRHGNALVPPTTVGNVPQKSRIPQGVLATQP